MATKIMIDEGNAMEIEFNRSQEDVLQDFSSYLTEKGLEIDTTTSNFVKTAPGSMNNDQTLRIKGLVEQIESGNKLVVITDFYDPTSDEWSRANNKRVRRSKSLYIL